MKRLAILGSTGSIGVSTLSVVKRFREEFDVVALAAGTNLALLRKQVETFNPKLVSCLNEDLAQTLKEDLTVPGVQVVSGEEGLIRAATFPEADLVVSAVVGSAGLLPLLAAIDCKKDVALANKESLVMAGQIIIQEAERQGVNILPVDSEHSAILQAMGGKKVRDGVSRIILTATGGPFYTLTATELQRVTPREAVAHPVWQMGPKISVDSATLMNKGLEIIEAHWLFEIPGERIDVVIHPQGIIHSLVEFVDGSMIAQLGVPDMKLPIAYALSYPKRLQTDFHALNLTEVKNLTFAAPDTQKFPCLKLAYRALEVAETLPAVLNAANEAAVEAFLRKKIRFDQIPEVVSRTMNGHTVDVVQEVADVLRADRWAREKASEVIGEVSQ